MTQAWQFVISQSAAEFLLACRTTDRRALVRALHQLAADPYQHGDFAARDYTGRMMQLRVVRGFLITYWTDSFVNELRVVRIERV